MTRTRIPVEVENALARAMQAGVPLVPRPFEALGQRVGLPESAVLSVVQRWSEDGILREISAVLEGAALGYDSALVTGPLEPERVDEVAAIVNAHPTVTHNYLRESVYPLWFTIAVPREMGVERTLELLARECGVEAWWPLRRVATFKIGVNFDLRTRRSLTERRPLRTATAVDVTARDRVLFRALQTPLPIEPRPFASVARQWDVTEEELLEFGRAHMGNAVRRYVATLRHRKAGVLGNAMVVWRVPLEEVEDVGPRVAEAPEVSHCYARQTAPGFPYTLYSMIHGPDRESCLNTAARIAREVGLDDYVPLFSTKEYKKCRLRYFLPELDAWWQARVFQEV